MSTGAVADEPGWFDVDLDRLRPRRTVKWSLYGPDVLAAWVAEMDFDVAPVVRDALHAAVDRDDLGYVVADLSELTTACSDFLREVHGWSVPPTRIFPIADVLGGITGALDVFVEAGAPVVVPTPAYPPFFEVVELTGRPVIEVPMTAGIDGRFVLDLDAIDAALDGGARAVLLCNPHNPTGRVFDRDELTALAAVVGHHGARVIADEVHAPLVHPGSTHLPYASVSDASAHHAITITSASKTFNIAGLKCAQIIASNHDDASAWRNLPIFQVSGPTPLGIAASIAAYRDGRQWREALLARLDANRTLLGELVAAEFPAVSYCAPEATFLSWIDCSSLGLDDPADHFLRHGNVAVSDGPPFRGGCGQYVRLNFGTSPELLERIVWGMSASLR